MELNKTLVEHIRIMTSEFICQNNIGIRGKIKSDTTKRDKIVVYATGKMDDNEFIKLWTVAKFPKIVLVTYNSEKKTKELKTVEKIVDSFKFENL